MRNPVGHFNVVYNQEPDTLISKNHFLYNIENFEIIQGKGTLSILCLNKKLLLEYTMIKKENRWEVKTANSKHK